jgi:hypothetical protein
MRGDAGARVRKVAIANMRCPMANRAPRHSAPQVIGIDITERKIHLDSALLPLAMSVVCMECRLPFARPHSGKSQDNPVTHPERQG